MIREKSKNRLSSGLKSNTKNFYSVVQMFQISFGLEKNISLYMEVHLDSCGARWYSSSYQAIICSM